MLAFAVSGPGAPGVDVIWDAPSSCPDPTTARAEILARVAERSPSSDVRATARVREQPDGAWQVEVELRTEQGTATRTLQATSCSEALTATAVVVAIAVAEAEPTAVVPTPPEPTPPPEPPPEPAEPPGVAEPPPKPQPRAEDPTDVPASPEAAVGTRRELVLSLGARGGLDYGALPSPAAHLAASAGLMGRRWLVQAGVVHRIRSETSVSLPRSAGGRFRMTAAELVAGPRLRWGAFELPLAAGLELGAIWARGIGDVEPITVRRAWAAAIASAGVGWAPRTRSRMSFALQLGLDGVLPLLRPTFVLGDDVEVLTVGSFAVRAWLGVAGRFSL